MVRFSQAQDGVRFPSRAALAVLACGGSLAWSGDAGIAETGTTYNAVPLRAVFNEDVRVVWLGDSFSLGATWRVSGGSLLTWPFTSDFVATTTGDIRATATMISTVVDPSVSSIDGITLWRLYQTGPEAGLDIRFALPTWDGREYYEDGSGAGPVPLVEYTGRTVLNDTAVGRFNEPGEALRVRPMFLTGQQGIAAAPRSYESATDTLLVDPSASATPPGQIGTPGEDLRVVAGADGLYEFSMHALGGTETGYIQTNGFTVWEVDEQGERQPGLSWSYLASSSWSYRDFGRDVPAQPGVYSKTFSREQLEHWLRATTLDAAQPVFAFYYFALESSPMETLIPEIRSMIEQTEGAGQDAGIGPIHHCFIVPHMHRVMDLGFDPTQFGVVRDAAVAVAQERDDMSVISMFDAMDGILLDGSPEAQAWLAARGHDNFVYGSRMFDYLQPGVEGDLLDGSLRHPEPSVNGSLLFSWYAGRAIIGACPADFAAPYGVLDLADIGKFAGLFTDTAYAADLREPQGVLDLADVSAFVESFLAGCAE